MEISLVWGVVATLKSTLPSLTFPLTPLTMSSQSPSENIFLNLTILGGWCDPRLGLLGPQCAVEIGTTQQGLLLQDLRLWREHARIFWSVYLIAFLAVTIGLIGKLATRSGFNSRSVYTCTPLASATVVHRPAGQYLYLFQ